jgi:hypothetical protein
MPHSTTLSEEAVKAAEYRKKLFEKHLPDLQIAAMKTVAELGLKNNEFIALIIQVDSGWRTIVDKMMPGYNWQAVRDEGKEPIVKGVTHWSFCEFVAKHVHGIAGPALALPIDDRVKAFVLSHQGASVFEIELPK